MKTIMRKLFGKFGPSSLKFGARSALVASTLVSSSRVFAGGTPSAIVPWMTQLDASDMMLIESLIEEKLQNEDLTIDERDELNSILEGIQEGQVLNDGTEEK